MWLVALLVGVGVRPVAVEFSGPLVVTLVWLLVVMLRPGSKGEVKFTPVPVALCTPETVVAVALGCVPLSEGGVGVLTMGGRGVSTGGIGSVLNGGSGLFSTGGDGDGTNGGMCEAFGLVGGSRLIGGSGSRRFPSPVGGSAPSLLSFTLGSVLSPPSVAAGPVVSSDVVDRSYEEGR